MRDRARGGRPRHRGAPPRPTRCGARARTPPPRGPRRRGRALALVRSVDEDLGDREGRSRFLEDDAHLLQAAVAERDHHQRLPAGARRAVHPLRARSARARARTPRRPPPPPRRWPAAWDRATPGRRSRTSVCGCGTDTTTPEPRATAAGDVHRRAAVPVGDGGGQRHPVHGPQDEIAGGDGTAFVVRRPEAVEHNDVARGRLAPRAAHLGEQLAEAGRPRHPPREMRRQHPRRPRVEVHLVAVTQGIARDALVPGLGRDHRVAALHGQAARELQARVRAADAGLAELPEGRIERRHLPGADRVRGIAPGGEQAAVAHDPWRQRPRPGPSR